MSWSLSSQSWLQQHCYTGEVFSIWPLTCTQQNRLLCIRQNRLPFETIGFISTQLHVVVPEANHCGIRSSLMRSLPISRLCLCRAHAPSHRRLPRCSAPIILRHIYPDRWLFTSRVCMCACLSRLSVKPTNKHPRQNHHHNSCYFCASEDSHEQRVSIGTTKEVRRRDGNN